MVNATPCLVRLVYVENHDSFSRNVLEVLPVPPGDVLVVQGGTRQATRELARADGVVVGPGPKDPRRAGLVEDTLRAVKRGTPLLGICLGHQAIGLALGARLKRSPPAHGVVERCVFEPSRWMPGIRGALDVMRYHSLSLTHVRAPLRVVASLLDGTVMAVEHETLPVLGLQFHPDSYATPSGRAMVDAFFRAVGLLRGSRRQMRTPKVAAVPRSLPATGRARVVSLQDLEHTPEFALLGPGFTGRWTLLTPGRGGARVTFHPFEDGPPTVMSGALQPVRPRFVADPPAPHVQFDGDGFLRAVGKVRAGIAAGDVYQVNVTRPATVTCKTGSQLLSRLCRTRVPRFAAWVRTRDMELVSASPEMLFDCSGPTIRVEPMKGTAPAGARQQLLASTKDQAELAMITDLLRDDLFGLCVPGSVAVLRKRLLLELPYVVQAVSRVAGVLRPGVTADDVVRHLHPGGSVTGAPRPAALEFIARLEDGPRGAYCGTLGVVAGGFARYALLIRTAFRHAPGAWTYGVGAGITWNSVAATELEELRMKLRAL